MWPTLYELQAGTGSIGLHSYGLLVLFAFCVSFLLVHTRALKIGLHPDRLIGVYVAAALGGLVGARLLYAFAVEPAYTLSNPASLLSMSGFAFYGGVLGGGLAVAALARLQNLPLLKLADIAAPAVVIGLGIGRIGCFFAGCCHGAEVELGSGTTPLLAEGTLKGQLWVTSHFPFLATEFHDGVGRLKGVPLYPTQLWSAAAGLGLGGALLAHWGRRRFDGQIAALALMVEPLTRVSIEVFRADHRGYTLTWQVPEAIAQALPGMTKAATPMREGIIGLTTSQTIGLAMIGVGLALYFLQRNAGVAHEEPIEERELQGEL